MKTRALFILAIFFLFQVPACIPVDEDIDPDDPVDKFLGSWNVSESCRRGSYTVDISKDPSNSAQVLLENLGNPGPGYDPAVGLVASDNIHVYSQTIGEGWTISGKGTYQTDGTIEWDYTLIIPPNTYVCSATFR
jgi:hypothetical protein